MIDNRTVLAIGAHPDDIEFMMGGTLVLLTQAGYHVHYMNLANGSCGTAELSREKITKIRTEEARKAADFILAAYHPPLVNDIEIQYEKKLLAQVAAVIRVVSPGILLVPSPEDYMEDHSTTSRLAVTAAFCRGMRNFVTIPKTPPIEGDMTVYHGMPYGLHDGMRRKIFPGLYVNITSVIDNKREMLAMHRSQKEWLDTSQGQDSYLRTMEDMSREVGRMSRKFKFAEGWRRHNHLGLSAEDKDPLATALRTNLKVNRRYEWNLGHPLRRQRSPRQS
ncbi:PIG-L deacetylase family protein [Planctomycetota bacterium]